MPLGVRDFFYSGEGAMFPSLFISIAFLLPTSSPATVNDRSEARRLFLVKCQLDQGVFCRDSGCNVVTNNIGCCDCRSDGTCCST